ncbi:2-C-methyl-D-erythritol 4-phosphate cytidylyltransferase [Micrococcus sp. FDAARGOS_333]|uniref:IspD/TarI family cytidylyltransferase n=1 Tax=Micrococcus sp. FDAARGOS_333 TaxID=1930558 RepID=UPI000B4E5D53|nr:IspD/TarI family cytidylyltransferase [Micrococcus sp. FDAARGOS_333]PNL17330.1 2-C-methyl-D-erythritol 4-phosphate cytidylyltransferase [Micrococcus sp. FDAARGOS_333]
MPTAVLLAAAGSGTRLGAGMPKALAPLSDGRTLLEHGLETVAQVPDVDVVVVLVPPADQPRAEVTAIVEECALRLGFTASCVPGGAERADSVAAGLAEVARRLGAAPASATPAPDVASAAASSSRHDDGTHCRHDPHLVLVHDAARPFTPPAVFAAVVAGLASAKAVIPAVPVTDTVKQVSVDANGAETVVGTPSRAMLRAVQTPQGFDLYALLAAHDQVRRDPELDAAALTDDAMVMEAAGHVVRVVPGHADAFKITTPADLEQAAALIARRSLS